VDPNQDATIIKAIDQELRGSPRPIETEREDDLSLVVDIKVNILKHLTAQCRRCSSLEGEGRNVSLPFAENCIVLRARLAQCLRLCSYLSLRLPRLRKVVLEGENHKVRRLCVFCCRESAFLILLRDLSNTRLSPWLYSTACRH
jgi:hypothetical protein